jgi:acetyl esterase
MKQTERMEPMPMDPELRRYLDQISASAPDLPETEKERLLMRRELMRKARESRGPIAGLPNSVKTRDLVIRTGLSARLYTPEASDELLPLLVYLHGGGWAAGSVETHDPFCRLLSQAAATVILSVEYRLAPENPFPAGLDDTLVATEWAREHASRLGADAQRLALGGDSAGANLAAVAANRICSGGGVDALQALLLLYPVMDHPSAGHASYVERGTGCGLEASLMEWFWNLYAAGVAPDDPEISPLRASTLPALPPTLVATAEYDPLRDEGVAYAEKLQAAGVAVTHIHAGDMHHNFPVHPGTVMRFSQSVKALNEIAAWLKIALLQESTAAAEHA